MKTKVCKVCGMEIPARAHRCPYCKRRTRTPYFWLKAIGALFLILLLAYII